MKVPRPRRSIPVAIAAIVLLVATACSSSGPATEAASDEPVVIAVGPVANLDPGLASSSKTNLTVVGNVYSSLTRVNPDGELVGDLATDWEQESDLVWRFTLRPDATFEDGSPLDAETVRWNFERGAADAKLTAVAKVVSTIDSIEVLSPAELRITTKDPAINLPDRLSGWLFLDPDWAQANDPGTQVNASGPYRLVSFTPDQSVVLEANPNYYGDAPEIENVEYRFFKDQSAIVAGLLSNDIDVAVQLNPSDLDQIEAAGGYRTGGEPGYRIHVLQVNASKAPWDDPLVREAAALAIDRESITENLLKGFTEPSHRQVFGVGYVGYQPDLEPWPYDPDRARELLEEAGALGAPAELTVPQNFFAGAERASEVIVEQLNAVGFDASLRVLPQASWSDLVSTPESAPPLIYIGEASPSNSSAEALLKFQSVEAYPATNAKGPVSPVIDQAVSAAWTASSVEQQALEVEAATAEIIRTARVIDLWPQPQTYVVRDDLAFAPRQDDLNRAYDLAWR